MLAQSSKPRVDRDTRREAILDVAQEVFQESGYAAASMSTIAARLGGSKGTLYNYFKSKDELFEAYVQRRCLWQQEEIYAGQLEGETAADTLTRVGRAYLRHVLRDDTQRNFRMIVAEAERYPEIGRMFYEGGPERGAERLAGMLEDMVAKGQLEVPDAKTAAHQFLALALNRYSKGRLCNYFGEPNAQEIEVEVAAAVETFMRAFGPR